MTEQFIIEPLLALILVAISSSLLGVFVLWNRLSYFGDAISHSVLLGLALGAIFNINEDFALLSFAILFALLVGFASQNKYFSRDLIISIASYFSIAIAIIVNDLTGKSIDFFSYIFGDINNVTKLDIIALAFIAIFCVIFVFLSFKKILLINVDADLARINGIKTEIWNILFIVLLTLTIALSVRIVGVFLMTALLVLPAANARLFSTSPTQMMLSTIVYSVSACIFALPISFYYEITAGAVAVIALGALFFLTLFVRFIKRVVNYT